MSAAFLGLVQALTEFLPVSSSGHLVLSQALLGIELDGGAAFEVAVHFGTLLSVFLLFRADILRLTLAALRALSAPTQLRSRWHDDADLRMVGAILIGCVPAGVVGLTFKDTIETGFHSTTLVGAALLATGVLLLTTLWAPTGDRKVGLRDALIIGIAQAIAITPGVSRSGTTIATALFLRVEREAAARFSFLISLPVIFGATLLKSRDLLNSPPPSDMLAALGVGAVISFVVGVGALWLLLGVVRRGWFPHFGWYCLTIGAAALTWSLG